jgi:hypothetical protein
MLHTARTKPFSCAGVHTFSTAHPEHSQFRAIVSFAEAFAEAFAGAAAAAAAAAFPKPLPKPSLKPLPEPLPEPFHAVRVI